MNCQLNKDDILEAAAIKLGANVCDLKIVCKEIEYIGVNKHDPITENKTYFLLDKKIDCIYFLLSSYDSSSTSSGGYMSIKPKGNYMFNLRISNTDHPIDGCFFESLFAVRLAQSDFYCSVLYYEITKVV